MRTLMELELEAGVHTGVEGSAACPGPWRRATCTVLGPISHKSQVTSHGVTNHSPQTTCKA